MSKQLHVLFRAGVLSLALSLANYCVGADSVVRAQDLTVARGETNKLFISLESLGAENALGFTLCYDTNLLTLLPPLIRGEAISNLHPTAVFSSDTSAESNGWAGLSIGLDAGAGEAWPAGTNFLVEVLFQAVAGSGSATTTVAFCDSVVARALTDVGSNVLAATFINATVLVQGPCAYQLSTNLVTAPLTGHSNSVSVTTDFNCAWSVENTNSWITIVGDAGPGSGNISLIVAPNLNLEPRAGTLTVAGQILTVNQDGIVCSYSLSPTNGTHGHGVESNSFSITAPTECIWTATTTNGWISLTSGTNGFGDGTVGYVVQPNPDNTSRSGTITVGDAAFSVSQSAAPCDATLTPADFNHGFGSETGIVSVAIVNGCAWEVSNTNSWITIDSGATGNGNGSVGYTVEENSSSLSRSGTVVIEGKPFVVTQSGAPCVFSIAPPSSSVPFSAATNTVTVTAISDCPWTISNLNSWIIFPAGTNGLGTTTNIYHVEANSVPVSRTGLVMLADQLLTVIQDPAPCSYALAPTNVSHGFRSETGLVQVTAHSVCAWEASTTESWITLSGTNGLGDGTVGFALVANPDSTSRTGTIQIANSVFTITQSGAPCLFTLVPATASHGFNSETGLVSITGLAGCAWTITNENTWITITSGASGTNEGTLGYSVDANSTTNERSGVIVIGGENFTVTQAGSPPPCTYELSLTNVVHDFGPATNSVNLITDTNCTWLLENTNVWITITSPTNGTGTAAIDYVLTTNLSSLERTGVVMASGQALTIIQHGTPCAFTVEPLQQIFAANAATGGVNVATLADCNWTAATTNEWLTILSAATNIGSGELSYAVAENLLLTERVGFIVVAEQTLVVTQQATICEYTIAPADFTHGSSSETGLVTVTTGINCPWQATTTNSWIAFTVANGVGNGGVAYSVEANPTALLRLGAVSIEGKNFTVTQSGATCSFALATNSATHEAGEETNSVVLTTLEGCAWSISNETPWITILSSINNSNSGVVSYSVATNPTALFRTGVVHIGGEIFTIGQRGAECSFALGANGASHGAQTETNVVTLTTLEGCEWSVSNSTSWIEILSPANNTNNGDVTYRVLTNPTALSRTGIVSIASQSFVVTQVGAECIFTLGTNVASHGSDGATGSVVVTTLEGCTWSVSSGISWITVSAPLDFTNDGIVNYAVEANLTALSRTGVVSIAGQDFIITQSGAACTFTLLATNALHGAGATNSSVGLLTLDGCLWNVVNTNLWIAILSGTNYTNSDAVIYSVEANPTALTRTGVLTIEGQEFTVTQSGADCVFTIVPGSATPTFLAATGSVAVTTLDGCEWNASNDVPWITILSSLSNSNSGSVTYSVMENTTALSRTGVVSIAGRDFTVTQSGAGCLFALGTNDAVHGAGLETNSVDVTTLLGCTWSVSNGAPWIEILSALDNTSSTNVSYRVLVNPDALWRTGIVNIAGLDLTVVQSPAACTFTLATNSATHDASATTNSVELTTLVGCAWSVSNGTPWIHILSSLDNSNSSSVTVQRGGQSDGTDARGNFDDCRARFHDDAERRGMHVHDFTGKHHAWFCRNEWQCRGEYVGWLRMERLQWRVVDLHPFISQ